MLVIPAAFALSRVFAQTPVPLRTGDPLPYLAVGAMLGPMLSFSHSNGNVEPCTTIRWKFGTL